MPEPPYSKQRRELRLSGFALLAMTFQTLGVVYSDIGTSPLYTLNGIWPPAGPIPPEEDIIGGLSTIFWALTVVPLIKYVLIALRFGTTEGEGGTFALYQGLFPPEHHNDEDDRTLTGESVMAISTRSSSEKLAGFKWLLLPWALYGTAATMADGVLTPAVSVTSAVGGISVAKPEVVKDIVPISIAFLIALFAVQRFGTKRLSIAYAPVTFLWLLLLGSTGIYNISTHPGVFRAIDPSRMVAWFIRTKNFDQLAGVLLAITGSEAMFANLGQFNRLSMQIGFGCFTYPMLVLAYFGQGARLIKDPENVITNVFYTTIPGPERGALYWIVWVFGILATLVASQATITAAFSLCQQLVNLKSLPPLRMKHTSDTVQGQIYFPFVNYTLGLATIIMVAAFRNLTNLSNAYGFAVSSVFLTTTVFIALQTHYTKHLPKVVALAFFVVFGFVDGIWVGASLKKIPLGAWVTLMIATVLALMMLFWTWCKGLEDKFDGMNRRNLRQFLSVDASESDREKRIHKQMETVKSKEMTTLTYTGSDAVSHKAEAPSDESDDASSKLDPNYLYLVGGRDAPPRLRLPRLPTCAVFHKLTSGRGVPHTFYGFLRQWPALPRVVIFLSVSTMNINHVPLEERYTVTKVRTLQGFYGVTYALGFRDVFLMNIDDIIDRICTLESRIGSNDEGDAIQLVREIREVAKLSTHIVPHYHVMSKPIRRFGRFGVALSAVRAWLIEGLYRRVATMFPETGNWLGSADEIIRVGINAQI